MIVKVKGSAKCEARNWQAFRGLYCNNKTTYVCNECGQRVCGVHKNGHVGGAGWVQRAQCEQWRNAIKFWRVWVCIDADCPHCDYPERKLDIESGMFACNHCDYTSFERNK